MEQEILHDTIYVVQSAASRGAWDNVEINELLRMFLHNLTPIVIVCTIAALSFAILRQALKIWHKERMAIIEKRIEKGALSEPKQKFDPAKYLRWGIVLLSLGLGGTIALLIGEGWGLLFFPPLFLGIGWVAYYFFLAKREESKLTE